MFEHNRQPRQNIWRTRKNCLKRHYSVIVRYELSRRLYGREMDEERAATKSGGKRANASGIPFTADNDYVNIVRQLPKIERLRRRRRILDGRSHAH